MKNCGPGGPALGQGEQKDWYLQRTIFLFPWPEQRRRIYIYQRYKRHTSARCRRSRQSALQSRTFDKCDAPEVRAERSEASEPGFARRRRKLFSTYINSLLKNVIAFHLVSLSPAPSFLFACNKRVRRSCLLTYWHWPWHIIMLSFEQPRI